MLVLDSCNTFMICEQKTSKAIESQSLSSLSWQSTAVVVDTGAAQGAPPAQESLNPEQQLCTGRCRGAVPPVSSDSSPQGAQW